MPNITIISATQSFFMVPPKDKHAEKNPPNRLTPDGILLKPGRKALITPERHRTSVQTRDFKR
jgi:hypothetical protein